jgi:hypothetical protein
MSAEKTDTTTTPRTDPLREAAKLIDLRYQRELRGKLLPTRVGTDIPLVAPEWIWADRLTAGELNLLGGEPMEGKSTIAIGLAARMSRGDCMPFDETPREPRTVLWCGPEEDTRKAAMPRFVAAGGDPARFVELVRTGRGPHMTFPSNAPVLDATLSDLAQRGHQVGLLIIDGISVILDAVGPGGRPMSENSNADVKIALEALLDVARKHDLAVLGLRHLGKGQNVALNNRALGSKAWEAMARSEWIAVPHPEDKSKRLLVPLKHSYARAAPRSIVYSLASADVAMSNGEVRSFGVASFIEESSLTKDDVVTLGAQKPKRVTKDDVSLACDAILELLEERQTFISDAELERELAQLGHVAAAAKAARVQLRQAKRIQSKQVNGGWAVGLPAPRSGGVF